jgi:16S rRNA processing protein RimM
VATPTHLAVGRLKKPHGVKGDVLVFPLTDAPEQVFTVGRRLTVLDGEGRPTGAELQVTVARDYHRAWLLHFAGIEDRTALEAMRERFLGIPASEGRTLDEGEFRLHELEGMTVVLREDRGHVVGTVHTVYDAPQGWLLGVRGAEGKEHLIPFTPAVVRRVDRAERQIQVTPPPGLLEL